MTDERRNELATGGPGSAEIGGTLYLVGQPNDQDFAAIRDFIRKKLRNPFQAIAEDLKYLPRELWDAAVRAATELKAGGGAEPTPEFFRQQAAEPDVVAFMAWLLVRKNHPDATYESIRPHVTAANVEAVSAALYDASGMSALGNRGGRSGS